MSNERLQKVLENLEKSNSGQLVTADSNAILYLTGHRFFAGERLLLLHISARRGSTLYLNELSDHPGEIEGVSVVKFALGEDGLARVIDGLDKTAPLGVDQNLPARYLIPLLQSSGIAAYSIASGAVDRARQRKDAREQALMIKSSEINDLAMSEFERLLTPGVTELEVKSRLRDIYLSLGADDIDFGIVAFGANAAEPHHRSGGTALKPGDAALLDVGCVVEGYRSDMTRTFFYKSVSDHHREVYETVLAANEAAERLIRPGVRFSELDGAARDVIASAGYGEYFIHRLGHSIGLQGHEPGDVSAYNHDTLEEGMIFSIEPGIYLPGDVGVRIEDLALVTRDGVRLLNNHPKALKVLG